VSAELIAVRGTCATCRFAQLHVRGEDMAGLCRRKPPMLLPGELIGYWTEIAGTDWCGEYADGDAILAALRAQWEAEMAAEGVPI
jgi:hypothetical protein